MGPHFVGTTLNRREQTSTEQTRSVDYASFPGELISQVVVYETPDTGLLGQGLAGTVDIRTVKPLNYRSMRIALNARNEEVGRELPESGKGDRFSGSFIDRFFDHTFGVAVGFARPDDNGGTNDDSGTWGGGTMTHGGNTVNVQYGGLNENSDQAAPLRCASSGSSSARSLPSIGWRTPTYADAATPGSTRGNSRVPCAARCSSTGRERSATAPTRRSATAPAASTYS